MGEEEGADECFRCLTTLITHHQQTDANETGRGTLQRRAPSPGGAGAAQSALQSQHRRTNTNRVFSSFGLHNKMDEFILELFFLNVHKS